MKFLSQKTFILKKMEIFFKSGKFSYKIPHSKLPFKKIMLLNSSLVGYIAELGAGKNYWRF
jgi:hypothetical protein